MTDYTDQRVQHLQFIEDVINRQAKNSFAVKGWSLTLSAGIFTFLLSQDPTKQVNSAAYFIVALPALLFWLLDAYYLRQERLFRCLYDEVRQDVTRPATEKPHVELFDMNTSKFDNKNGYISVLFNETIWLIPVMVLVASVALWIVETIT